MHTNIYRSERTHQTVDRRRHFEQLKRTITPSVDQVNTKRFAGSHRTDYAITGGPRTIVVIFMPVARRKSRFLDMSIKWERVYSGRIPFEYRTITGLIQASRRCLAGCSPWGGLLHFVRTAGYIMMMINGMQPARHLQGTCE